MWNIIFISRSRAEVVYLKVYFWNQINSCFVGQPSPLTCMFVYVQSLYNLFVVLSKTLKIFANVVIYVLNASFICSICGYLRLDSSFSCLLFFVCYMLCRHYSFSFLYTILLFIRVQTYIMYFQFFIYLHATFYFFIWR